MKLTDFAKLNIGNKALSELLTEDKAIWHNNYLPEGYIKLDYIASSGTQYIDTLIKLKGTDKVKITYQYLITTQTCRVFGTDETIPRFMLTTADEGKLHDRVQIGYNNTWYNSSVTASTSLLECRLFGNGTFSINNEEPIDMSHYKFEQETDNNCLLFGANYNGSLALAAIKLYNFSIKRNGEFIRCLIPCKNASNVVGLYDTVSKEFFSNKGSGVFVAGPISS